MDDIKLHHAQIGVFNPGRLSDQEIEKSFVARQKLFDYLLNKITQEDNGSIPQQYLLIGQRGIGKSTLLNRIAVELRKAPHNKSYIALSFPEEQYNVDGLGKFWLNCMDALADALDKDNNAKNRSILTKLDNEIKQLTGEKNSNHIYERLNYYCGKIGRRPILLVDNLNLIFDRLEKSDHHALRGTLMSNNAPIMVGASFRILNATVDYGAAFYDAFQIHHLQKLTLEESIAVLENLAQITGNEDFNNKLIRNKAKLKTLYQLTGGTPRTLVMLYPIIQQGFSSDLQYDLDALMDVATPLYKARFEELPPQMQIILDAIALNWDPTHISVIREVTSLENSKLSPQLKRLTEVGWLQKMDAYQAKGAAYEISERFFNIWYLMRRSSRRQKRELVCLTRFLETFYKDELEQIGSKRLFLKSKHSDDISLNLALAEAISDPEVAEKLRSKSYTEILELAFHDKSIRNDFEIPSEFISKQEQELLEKTQLLITQENYAQAIINNEKLTILNETKPSYYNQKANILEKQSKHNLAEIEYRKSLELDSSQSLTWIQLALLFQFDLKDFTKAENAYQECIIKGDKQLKGIAYTMLAKLYKSELLDYRLAEQVYIDYIHSDSNYDTKVRGMNLLGNLYQDDLSDFIKAEEIYKKALKLSPDDKYVKISLIRLYRDVLGNLEEANSVFNSLKPTSLEMDSYLLHQSIFQFYAKNIGYGLTNVKKALTVIKEGFSYETKDDWYRFGAITAKLGYGQEIIDTLKEQGFDQILRPYYIAIKAMIVKDAKGYLNSVAAEIREPAKGIHEYMKNYVENYPLEKNNPT
ncbi:MAG: tetratricopeptide (TPR) repeat protein [Cyclobacteriaceae bacterium]|jgi:tetratricopeptide (TPR) repeat protein